MRLERGFRGRVGVAADHGRRGGDDAAGDVDDAAPAGGEHAWQDGGSEGGGRDHVDLAGQAQVPGLNAGRGAERLDGCRVVDQDVDAARREHRRRRQRAPPLVGEVGGHHADPPGGHAPLPEQAAGLLQLPRGAGKQHHPAPVPARPSAMARPMPRPAPVISAVLPVKSVATAFSSGQRRERPGRGNPRPFTQIARDLPVSGVSGGRQRGLTGRTEFAGKTRGRRDAYGNGPSGAVARTPKENRNAAAQPW